MEFEWDINKAKVNLDKHGIDFADAARIFLDSYRLETALPYDLYRESRYKTTGIVDNRILVVIYTLRGNKIRIISARKAEKYERKQYQEF